MANAWARDRAGWFYAGFGFVSLAAIATGFSTTYVIPMGRRTFAAPPIVHLHAALCLSWVLLFTCQTLLVRNRSTRLHRRLGWLAVPLAIGIPISGFAVGLWAARRDIAEGPTAISAGVGVLAGLTIFALLVGSAIVMRKRPDWHKRLMLLATIAVLWPAWSRFRHLMPWMPRPEIWLALIVPNVPILIAAIRDRIRYGKVHPAWLYVGSAFFAEQSVEVLAFDGPAWRAVTQAIYRLFTG